MTRRAIFGNVELTTTSDCVTSRGGVVNPNEFADSDKAEFFVNYAKYDSSVGGWYIANSNTTEIYQGNNRSAILENGVTYTISFETWYTGVAPVSAEYFLIAYNPVVIPWHLTVEKVPAAPKKVALTFVCEKNTGSFNFRFDNNGTSVNGAESRVYIRNIKLERGDKATDYVA